MPVSKLHDLPHGGEDAGHFAAPDSARCSGETSRWAHGDASGGPYAALPGLPGRVCPCPHHGYMFKGRLRCQYPESDWPDEVAGTGDAYFFREGHVLIYQEESEVLELTLPPPCRSSWTTSSRSSQL